MRALSACIGVFSGLLFAIAGSTVRAEPALHGYTLQSPQGEVRYKMCSKSTGICSTRGTQLDSINVYFGKQSAVFDYTRNNQGTQSKLGQSQANADGSVTLWTMNGNTVTYINRGSGTTLEHRYSLRGGDCVASLGAQLSDPDMTFTFLNVLPCKFIAGRVEP